MMIIVVLARMRARYIFRDPYGDEEPSPAGSPEKAGAPARGDLAVARPSNHMAQPSLDSGDRYLLANAS